MNYSQNLITTIRDSKKWPSVERPDFTNNLNSIAKTALSKNSVEGYLAALLIFHQLCEEMAGVILKNAQFFIQLSVFPAEIVFPEKKKLMFGQLIEELKSTISFKYKDEFIEKCVELNKHRIDIVHRLIKRSSLADLKAQLLQVKELYDEIYKLFFKIDDRFYVCFKDFEKDKFIDYSLEEFETPDAV
jgi:hypothetical protein